MIFFELIFQWFHGKTQQTHYQKRNIWTICHIDFTLLIALLLLIFYGFFILYSASNQDFTYVKQQAIHIGIASFIMLLFAQIHPRTYQRWAPTIYGFGITLLLFVLISGHINKGAQRWLGSGAFRFQPSEILKLALPMMFSYILAKHILPPKPKIIALCLLLLIVPVVLVAKQPDLGTSIILAGTGISVLFLAGLSKRFISIGSLLLLILAPVLWYFMHDYQRQRVLTFLNPERDPLGSGYHIIQSKIAIGSGGVSGKGWLLGSQSHLHFLPEHTTDFIFAVCGEELGLIGAVALIAIYVAIILRGLYITLTAQDTFSRLLAGGVTLTFFLSVFINIGMVTGILPVVGVPLPLVSYGGTSLVTIMAGFGILMSIQTHRKLLMS